MCLAIPGKVRMGKIQFGGIARDLQPGGKRAQSSGAV